MGGRHSQERYRVRVHCQDCTGKDPAGCFRGGYGWVEVREDPTEGLAYQIDDTAVPESRAALFPDVLAADNARTQVVTDNDWAGPWTAEIVDRNGNIIRAVEPDDHPGHTANPDIIEDRIEHISGYTIYPHGLTDLDDVNAPSFAVEIVWRGEYQGRSGGGWAVTRGRAQLLTSSVATGQKWDYPERFRRWQYRFATFEEALAAARSVVDGVKINGRTWAEWTEHERQDEGRG